MDDKDLMIDMLAERILELKEQIKRMDDEMDRLTALNRHYLHFFYQGDVLKMKEDFKYLT